MARYSIASFADALVHALIRKAEWSAEHYRAATDIAMVVQAVVVLVAETAELAIEVVEVHGHAPKPRFQSHHLAVRKQQAPLAMGPYVWVLQAREEAETNLPPNRCSD